MISLLYSCIWQATSPLCMCRSEELLVRSEYIVSEAERSAPQKQLHKCLVAVFRCLLRGAEEACWAHNPKVLGSKPSGATLFFLFVELELLACCLLLLLHTEDWLAFSFILFWFLYLQHLSHCTFVFNFLSVKNDVHKPSSR